MNRLTILIPTALYTLFAWLIPTCRLLADDPLKAMPTAEDSIEAKVKRLTETERQAIELPKEGDQVVLSIAKGPTSTEQNEAAPPIDPWLRVYADGRIDCANPIPLSTQRRTDTLTKDELLWLLHLTVNECRGLGRSTTDTKSDDKTTDGKPRATAGGGDAFHYHVHLAGNANDFSLPERALVTRPVRNRLKLAAFASLHAYANYLVARAFLGTPADREAILKALNEKLKLEHPEVPPFRMEHLGAAMSMDKIDLSAMFQQEIDLGDNKFRKVTGQIIRQEAEAKPIFSIQTLEFSKYRP